MIRMKFRHKDPEIKDTHGVGVTRPGDVIEETRQHIIDELLKNPVFEVVKNESVKTVKGDK